MPIKHYSYHRLTDLRYATEDGDDSNMGYINLEYSPDWVCGSLDECLYAGFNLRDMAGGNAEDVLPEDMPSVWRINDIANFVYDPEHGASFVISIDEALVDLGRYRCPVCGDTGPFSAYPPTLFYMDETGGMTIPEGMAVDPSFEDTVPCTCKQCGFEGHKAAFDTGGWDEYEGAALDGLQMRHACNEMAKK